jgi:2-methylisocitrate lyase-like PEP mutase family enzyme
MSSVEQGVAELEAMLRDYEANVERAAGDPQFVLQARTALLLSSNLQAIERRLTRLEEHVGLRSSGS